MPTNRSTTEEAFAAGLVALRAQGLEPSDFAKDLAQQVIDGKITGQQMEETLLERYRKQDAITTNCGD
jgi:hypothetical protein